MSYGRIFDNDESGDMWEVEFVGYFNLLSVSFKTLVCGAISQIFTGYLNVK
jgi:hypothetical protein